MKVGLSLSLLVTCAVPCLSISTKRPRELILERDSFSGTCSVIALRETQIVRNLPEDGSYVTKQQTVSGDERLSIITYSDEIAWSKSRTICAHVEPTMSDSSFGSVLDSAQDILSVPTSSLNKLAKSPPLKIEPLLQSGPSNNRVDLVFFSDGYLVEEKEKFLDDAKRLAEDISNNQTFNTVQPLLNFWTAFTPSNESGIGVGGEPKDTPFGLYRDGTELRGVYYDKPEVARAACLSMGDQCDYPILMGNDPFYGGLGGEFTVITPSLANGALVLRHELGHSIIEVGEEYDGGYAYFGVNALNDLAAPIPWSHWLTQPLAAHPHSQVNAAARRVERSVMPIQAYPWTLLNISSPWSVQFSSSGQYARHIVRFSLSGLPDASDLSVALDGEDLGWIPRPDIGVDRWHYDVPRSKALKAGLHELSFRLKSKNLEGTAQLCSAEILEFGTADEFVATPGHYALYPTFSESNTTSYRPTNEDCLMRVVTTPNFCKVCLEGLWLSLLRRVDFIDTIATSCEQVGVYPPWYRRHLDLSLVPLGQFRWNDGLASNAGSERYSITWSKDGTVLDEFADQIHIEVDDEDGDGVGLYSVEIRFATADVRVDPDKLLRSGGDFMVFEKCGSKSH